MDERTTGGSHQLVGETPFFTLLARFTSILLSYAVKATQRYASPNSYVHAWIPRVFKLGFLTFLCRRVVIRRVPRVPKSKHNGLLVKHNGLLVNSKGCL